MAANNSADETPMAQVVEPARLAIALASRVDESEPVRFANAVGAHLRAIKETCLKRDGDVLSKTDADEASRRNRVARANKAHSIAGRDDLTSALRAQCLEALFSLVVHEYPWWLLTHTRINARALLAHMCDRVKGLCYCSHGGMAARPRSHSPAGQERRSDGVKAHSTMPKNVMPSAAHAPVPRPWSE